MFCPECGYPLPDDADKCEYCGHIFRASNASKRSGVSENSIVTEEDESEVSYKASVSEISGQKNISNGTKQPNNEKWLAVLIGIAAIILLVGVINIAFNQVIEGESHGTLSLPSEGTNQDVNDDIIDQNVDSNETVDSRDEENAQGNDVAEPTEKPIQTTTPTPVPTSTPTPTPYPLSTVKAHVTDRKPDDLGRYVRPVFSDYDASSALHQEKHPEYDNTAKSLIDGDPITSWQEGVAGDGTAEQIKLGFDDYRLIHYIELKLGNWRTEEYYDINNRPKQMELEIEGTRFTLDFTDAMIPHYIEFDHPVRAKQLTFTINSVYKGTEANDCCIAEITAYTE